MEQAHVDTQFAGLVSRTWLPTELDALTASIWESPATDAERALVTRTEEWCKGAAFWSQRTGNSRRNGKPRDKRVTFLPVFRYLRGEFDA